jgi:DNA-binding MarR family transcriptional regulator
VIIQDSLSATKPVVSSHNGAVQPQHDNQMSVLELLNQINAVAIRLRQRARAEPGAESGISVAEHAVLDLINRSGTLTVPQIAQKRFTSRQNIQILVDRLEKQGHLEIAGNPAHKRSVLVRLTELGRAWLADDERSRKQFHNEIGSLFSGEEVVVLASALSKLHGALTGTNRQTETGQKPKRSPRPPKKANEVLQVQAVEPEMLEEEFPLNLL